MATMLPETDVYDLRRNHGVVTQVVDGGLNEKVVILFDNGATRTIYLNTLDPDKHNPRDILWRVANKWKPLCDLGLLEDGFPIDPKDGGPKFK